MASQGALPEMFVRVIGRGREGGSGGWRHGRAEPIVMPHDIQYDGTLTEACCLSATDAAPRLHRETAEGEPWYDCARSGNASWR